jgi:hypothetical protein
MEPAPARPHHEAIDHDDLLVHNCGVTRFTRPRILGPLASGVLTGKYTRGNTSPEGSGRAWHAARRMNEETFAVLDVLEAVSEDLGSPMAAVALAWVRQQPEVSSTITGARTVDQPDANLSSLQVTIPERHLARLEEATPPAAGVPGRPAARYRAGLPAGRRDDQRRGIVRVPPLTSYPAG